MQENKSKVESRYVALIALIFKNHYKKGMTEFEFERGEIDTHSKANNIKKPDNLGDLIYSFRYRNQLPEAITKTAPAGLEWVIEGAGRSRYRFILKPFNRIEPSNNLIDIKIPDSTPEIISSFALGDEQALLAKVRYNRLIDIFLGITAFSLQNHLRTTVKSIGQIEIDEIYVGLDRYGRQFVIPVQAKGGTDKHGIVQTEQDIALCDIKFPSLICRPVSAQFIDETRIAMFELCVDQGSTKIIDEKHYILTSDKISDDELKRYSLQAKNG